MLQGRGFFVALTAIAALFAFAAGGVFSCFGCLWRVALADAMGNEVDHVQAGDALLMKVIHRVGIFFAKDGDQDVRTVHFFFATARRLNVHDGALNHALETQSGLRVDFFATRHLGRVVLDEIAQGFAQVVNVGGASAQHFGRAGVVQQSQQQVLNGDEFVALLTGFNKGHVQADF